MTFDRVKFYVVCVWVVCLVTGLWPVVGGLAASPRTDDVNICGESYNTEGGSQSIAQLYSTTAVLTFFLVIVLLYCRILSISWKHFKTVNVGVGNTASVAATSSGSNNRQTEQVPVTRRAIYRFDLPSLWP